MTDVVIVDTAGDYHAEKEGQSVQAERRERELARRTARKTTPPLASPFSTQAVGVTYHADYPQGLNDLRERLERPSKAEFEELTRSYPNFGGEMAQMYAESDWEDVMERGHRVTEWITLKREPDNPHDSNAISVWWDGIQLGHLNKVIAFRLAQELDEGQSWLARAEEVAGEDHQPGLHIRMKR